MYEAALVGGAEGLGDLRSEGGSDLRFGGPTRRDTLFERAPRDLLHCYIRGTVLRFPAIVDLDDVRVREAGGALGLALEALDELLVVGELLPQDLESYVPIEDLVVGQVHLGHPSATQGMTDAVTVVYDGFLHVPIPPLR
jgi:hypothetical protein